MPLPTRNNRPTSRPHHRHPRPASGTDDMLDQLKQLGELHDAGVLTDEEFAAQKAKILAQ